MQGKYDTWEDFLRRTDALAVRMGLNVQDLTEVLGIGRASLFSYRSGKRSISSKAWLKLKAAEEAAGIKAEEVFADDLAVVREDLAPYVAKPLRKPGEPTLMEQVAELRVCYDNTRAELAEANRKLDALMDLLGGKTNVD